MKIIKYCALLFLLNKFISLDKIFLKKSLSKLINLLNINKPELEPPSSIPDKFLAVKEDIESTLGVRLKIKDEGSLINFIKQAGFTRFILSFFSKSDQNGQNDCIISELLKTGDSSPDTPISLLDIIEEYKDE